MELELLKKTHLIQIANQSPFFSVSMNRKTKTELIEFIKKENLTMIPLSFEEMPVRLLLKEAEKYPHFIKKKHGADKKSLCDFLTSEKEENSAVSPLHVEDLISNPIDHEELRKKIIECFTDCYSE